MAVVRAGSLWSRSFTPPLKLESGVDCLLAVYLHTLPLCDMITRVIPRKWSLALHFECHLLKGQGMWLHGRVLVYFPTVLGSIPGIAQAKA